MKIKRFNNLWTMGLIILIGILVAIYCVKIINPAFIVGVAETESIVKIGTYIDTHKWAYYLANIIISFVVEYFYCCACCRKIKLKLRDLVVVIISIVISLLAQTFIPQFFSVIDICLLVAMPMIINAMDKNYDASKLYSFGITFIVHNLSQIISLQIRDVALMISQHNFATYIVLLIDAYIWLFVMYNLFNFKKEQK
jgi:hypothetical protein